MLADGPVDAYKKRKKGGYRRKRQALYLKYDPQNQFSSSPRTKIYPTKNTARCKKSAKVEINFFLCTYWNIFYYGCKIQIIPVIVFSVFRARHANTGKIFYSLIISAHLDDFTAFFSPLAAQCA